MQMDLRKIFQLLDLSKVDKDEIVFENSRRSFLKRAGTSGIKGALASLPVALALFPKIVKAQNNAVVETLNFALKLEYLESEFYNIGTNAGVIPAADVAIFAQIKKHETAHVAFLKNALGTSAIAKPTFDFTASGTYASVFTSYSTFLSLAQAFEDTGVRAYKGQVSALQEDNETLTAALQIHSVEARHAAMIRRLRGKSTTQSIKGWITKKEPNGLPVGIYEGEDNVTHAGTSVNAIDALASLSENAKTEAFDEPLTKAQITAIIQPFIKA
jgi:rubrerythrin